MIAFGAAFGYTVMSRMSLLIGRLGDLIKTFASAAYGYATPILLAVTVISLGIWKRPAAAFCEPRLPHPFRLTVWLSGILCLLSQSEARGVDTTNPSSVDRPKLRDLEFFPVREGENQSVGLRDPQGISKEILFLPPNVFYLIQFLDGQHTRNQIAGEYLKRFGELLLPNWVDKFLMRA